MKKHKIPVGTVFSGNKLTLEEQSYKQDVQWHSVTPQEIIFIKTYYLAKNKALTNQFITVSVMILIIELLMAHLKTVIFVTTVILLIAFVVFQMYLKTWQNIDVSAMCAYIPIYQKYHITRKNKDVFYTVIIVDGKKYTYRLDNPKNCCNYVMITNYKGLSCAINSSVFPN
jgi:hypothetical protein